MYSEIRAHQGRRKGPKTSSAHSPPLPPPLPLPFPPLPLEVGPLPLPLEVGPLNPASGSVGAL